MDRAPRARRPTAGTAAGSRGLAWKTRSEPRSARMLPRTYADYRYGSDAYWTRKPPRGNHRRDSGLGARGLHRRWHRRDSAQHHQRARAWIGQGATVRYRAVPERAKELAEAAAPACRELSSV